MAALAASYGVALARNHAFIDGNKRAAFLAAGLFLALNGNRLRVSQTEATLTMLGVASGTVNESQLATSLRRHISPR